MKRPARKRVRRSAEESRTAILDVTERHLVASGPDGIRLQDVAREVGIAHTTILHHFGSRERLLETVVRRRIDTMNDDVIQATRLGVLDDDVVASVLARLFEAFGPGGHARVVAYVALAKMPNPSMEGLRPVAQALHAVRVASQPPGAPPLQREDTDFIVQIVAFALFGEAITGPLFRGEPPDAPDAAARERFLKRFERLVGSLLAS
jgi:AcrR family transcriptional regulator